MFRSFIPKKANVCGTSALDFKNYMILLNERRNMRHKNIPPTSVVVGKYLKISMTDLYRSNEGCEKRVLSAFSQH